MSSQKLIQEIKMKLGGPTPKAAAHARYIGAQNHKARKKDEQSGLTFWGHHSPRINALAQYEWDALKNLSLEKQWDIWIQTWKKSSLYEIKSIGLAWIGSKKLKNFRQKRTRDLLLLAPYIDNWAHSDELSSLLAALLEENPQYFSTYKKWNFSENPWLRRQSIVGIYCYARLRKKHFSVKKTLKLIQNLLDDPHFYVQRGVGWTLREVDRVDSRLQRKFVEKHLDRISAVAWFATSELYPLALRQKLVQKRKTNRSQK